MNIIHRVIETIKKKRLNDAIQTYCDIIELNILMLEEFPEMGIDSDMIYEVEGSYILLGKAYREYVSKYREKPSASYKDAIADYKKWSDDLAETRSYKI